MTAEELAAEIIAYCAGEEYVHTADLKHHIASVMDAYRWTALEESYTLAGMLTPPFTIEHRKDGRTWQQGTHYGRGIARFYARQSMDADPGLECRIVVIHERA